MGFVRAIGWIMVFPAVLVLAYGLVIWHEGVPIFDVLAGDYLAGVGAERLDFVQVFALSNFGPWLQSPDPMMILLLPLAHAIAVFAGVLATPGVVVLILFRRGWAGALILKQYSR